MSDEPSFAALTARYRRELHIHCYRMVGSFEQAEDLVQETLVRAWRRRGSFEARSTFRAWLYRIATNACLDELRRRKRRLLPYQVAQPNDPSEDARPRAEALWLQPYPDDLLNEVAASGLEPETAAVSKETIELAFLAAIQLLTPGQRAVLILRDVLGWPGPEVASVLGMSVAAVDSNLQRGRAALRRHWSADRSDWRSSSQPTDSEAALLRRYLRAHEGADPAALAELLREDVRFAMPPRPTWFLGREAVVDEFRRGWGRDLPGDWRLAPIRANRQPGFAAYLRRWGDDRFRAFALVLLATDGDRIAEITAFGTPHLFPAFGLSPTMD